MTEKELRKLSRTELLEMLIAQSEELKICQEKLAAAEENLQKREIIMDNAGSIAEASLALNGIFEAAQAACQQYTDNIRQLQIRQEISCARMEEESRTRVEQVLSEAEQKRISIERETEIKCNEMVKKAEFEAQNYWNEVSEKMEAFYNAHAGLRELLSSISEHKR